MSDDLVERLREVSFEKHQEAWGRLDGGQDLTIGAMLAEQAADRIEELEERLKAATDDAKEAEDYAGELEANLAEQIEWVKSLADDLIAAEGREARLKEKLAKVISLADAMAEAIEDQIDTCDASMDEQIAVKNYRTTLAELTGGQEDRKMSDDLVKRAKHNALSDMPHYASVELIEALADRIEELEEKLAKAVSRLDKLTYWLDIDQELWDAFTVMEKSDHRHMQSEVQAIKDILTGGKDE